MQKEKKEDKNVKIWGEHINIKEFLIGLVISLVILLLSIFITDRFFTQKYETKLIVGLITVLIVFGFNLVFIKPKRNIVVKKDEENDN